MERVDYYWVDDMIDHITFGKHAGPKDIIRKKAKGEEVADDRAGDGLLEMRIEDDSIFWSQDRTWWSCFYSQAV